MQFVTYVRLRLPSAARCCSVFPRLSHVHPGKACVNTFAYMKTLTPSVTRTTMAQCLHRTGLSRQYHREPLSVFLRPPCKATLKKHSVAERTCSASRVSLMSLRPSPARRVVRECRSCQLLCLPGLGGTSPPHDGNNRFGGWGGGGAYGASRALSAVASSAPQLGSEEIILLDVSGAPRIAHARR